MRCNTLSPKASVGLQHLEPRSNSTLFLPQLAKVAQVYPTPATHKRKGHQKKRHQKTLHPFFSAPPSPPHTSMLGCGTDWASRIRPFPLENPWKAFPVFHNSVVAGSQHKVSVRIPCVTLQYFCELRGFVLIQCTLYIVKVSHNTEAREAKE